MHATSAADACRSRRRSVGRRAHALLAAFALGLGGCGDSEVGHEIRDVRVVERAGPRAPLGASDEERFHGDEVGSPHGASGMGAPAPAPRLWKFTTPAGWTELPPATMRDHGWRVGSDAECTLSTLEGEGGGLAANVNRWRRQMSQPPIEDVGLASLPTIAWLGTTARRVELDGAYRGMGTSVLFPEARLLGLVAVFPRRTVFLKLVGPAGVVAAERARFEALAASLSLEEGPPEPVAPDHSSPPPRIAWTAPAGWVQQPDRPMREVTFSPAAAPAVSVYISLLVGTAGGLRANVDRWRNEMALGPITDADLAALPRGPVLGGTGVYVEMEGTFTGMSGSPAPGSALLGLVLERPQGSVFVKMTGPAALVRAERERFKAFCESLRE